MRGAYQSSTAGTSKAGGEHPSSKPWSSQPPPSFLSASSVMRHQILSFPIIVLLFSTALPFSPVAWLTGPNEGAYLFDRFVGGVILLCALYFQFKLSGLTYPVVITITNPLSQSETYVRDGKIHKATWGPEFTFVYNPRKYYLYTAAEVSALLVGNIPGLEYVRRVVVLCVLAALWVGGWRVTPESTKKWAWGHIKWYWTWMVFDVLRDIYMGGRAGGRRRRY